MTKISIPEKPKSVQWTDDQWKAIMAKGQDILVAAAAGSGKTAVLVERIIQRILSKTDPVNVDELLVVTFTNAAAAEMRHRIGEALEKAIKETPDSHHLRRQLSLLNGASISTLHSFCLNVVRNHYYLVDIDPGFRIADSTELDLLRDEVLDELFEEEYGKEDNEAFFHLVDAFASDRSDTALQELISEMYDFSRSHPAPNQWLDQIVDHYNISDETKIEDLPFYSDLQFDIQMQLKAAKELFKQALNIAKLPGGPTPRIETYEEDLMIIQTMEEAKSWEELYKIINQYKFPRAKPCKGDEYIQELMDEANQIRESGKKIIEKIKNELFSRTPEAFLQDIRNMKETVTTLVLLVKKFAQLFSDKKAEKGILDFSDLEHLCLQILIDQDDTSGNVKPSEIAQYYRQKFKEILVDEYQDTNMVQETIIRIISQDNETDGNVFMVGDVKQSIYRFRLAEPNLFLDKYQRFTVDGKNSGLRIDLSRNFRSRREVLEGTNFIFKQIMGTNVGEIEYNSDAELIKGADYPDEPIKPVECIIIEQAQEETNDNSDEEDSLAIDLKQSQLEARIIAKEIRKLIDERKTIYDVKTKTERPIQYKDIVILLRSFSWAPEIMDELKHFGIPSYADLSTGYFDATEISIMLSLLHIIDNPDQDIPLASVLRSPIVGLDEEGLAQIRIVSKRGSYYEAVKQFLTTSPDEHVKLTWKKVSYFMNQLEKWRQQAREGSLSDLIWQLYRETGYYEFVGGLPGGKQRQANLRALYDRARQYEETSFRGLFRFLRFIERMREREKDFGVAPALGEEEDVVKLITIHSSKGLEFPVVFVAGLGRKFNKKDIYRSYFFDKEYGFASKFVDPVLRISYTTLPQIALRKKKTKEMLAEEMRILYVAMTRAKEKLYLIGSVKNLEKAKNRWSQVAHHADWLLADYHRASADSYLDWVGMALIRHEEGEILLNNGRNRIILNHPSHWKIEIFNQADLEEQDGLHDDVDWDWMEAVIKGKPVPMSSPYKEEVWKRLEWTYPFRYATSKMSKQSVTELKRLFDMIDETSSQELIRNRGKHVFERPAFMQEKKGLSPAEYGTAMHTVMQHIPLDKKPENKDVEQLLNELVFKEILLPEQAEEISIEQIVEFFESPLGETMLTAHKVVREVPFTIGIPAKEIYADWHGGNERVLVQGIIDCLMVVEEGVILLDYKTDTIHGRFPGGFEQAQPILKKRYETQLSFYERAVKEIWKKEVVEKYLYFFDGGYFLSI